MPMNEFTIIIKVTDYCNLSCKYCYTTCSHSSKMSAETLVILLKKAFRSDCSKLNFIWIGGEPLIMGIDFYELAVSLQNELSNEHRMDYDNSIQTNGVMLNEDIIEFFVENEFRVGVSIDGPQHLNDKNRTNKQGKSVYNRLVRNIRKLVEYGVTPGIISVVTDFSTLSANEYFDWLRKIKCNSISFNIDFNNRNKLVVDINRFAEFLLSLQKQGRGDFQVNIRELIKYMNHKASIGKYESCDKGVPCLYNHFAVNPLGEIYACCDRFEGNDNYKIGNIAMDNFSSIFERESFYKVEQSFNSLRDDCSENCSNSDTCSGFCFADLVRNPINKTDNPCLKEQLYSCINQLTHESLI